MKATAQRPDVSELCKVLYDQESSTAYAEVYRADSDSTEGVVHKVTFLPRTGRWTCTCRGASHGHTCRHQRRAQRKRRVRFFSAIFVGQPPRVLRAELARREERVAAGMADQDDWACLDMIAMRLENIEAA